MRKRTATAIAVLLVAGLALAGPVLNSPAAISAPGQDAQPMVTTSDCGVFGGHEEAASGINALTWVSIASAPEGVSRVGGVFDSSGKYHLVCGNCMTHTSHPTDQIYNPATNAWSVGLTHPAGTYGVHNHDVALIHSNIYVGGGSSGASYYNNLTAINLIANTWTSVVAMPVASLLYYRFAVGNDGKLYLFGGAVTGTTMQNICYQYTPGGAWVVRTPMPAVRRDVQTATYGDTIYVFGGSATTAYTGTNTLWKYSVTGNTWTVGTASTVGGAMWGRAFIFDDPSLGPIMYVCGGYNASGAVTNAVLAYNIRAGTWSTETSLPVVVRSHAGDISPDVFDGRIGLMVGGWNSGGILANGYKTSLSAAQTVDVSASGVALPRSAMPVDTVFYPVVTITNQGTEAQSNIPVALWIDSAGTRVYTGAGNHAGSLNPGASATVPMTTTYRTGPGGNLWNLTAFTDLSGDLNRRNDTCYTTYVTTNWVRRADNSLATYRTAGAADASGHFYLIGGNAPQTATRRVQRWTAATNTWDTVAPLPVALSNINASYIPNLNKIYTWGGYTGTAAVSTVYIFDVATGVWSTSPTPLPQVGYGNASTVLGDTAFVMMATSGGAPANAFYAYNTATNTVASRLVRPGILTSHGAMCTFNGKVYHSGGWSASTDFYVYTPGLNTWAAGPVLPVGRNGHGMDAYNGKIYVYGGGQTWTPLAGSSFYSIDVTAPTPAWALVPGPMLASCHSGGFAQGSLMASSGLISTTDPSVFHETYSLEPPAPQHDVGCRALMAPTGTVNNGTTVTPACSVYNFGSEAESYDVRMEIGTGYDQTATVTDHAAGTALYVTFPAWTAGPNGTHAVTCSTELATDVENDNDRAVGQVEVQTIDVGVVAIVGPTGTHDTADVIVPSATVKNYGSQDATFTVTFLFDVYTSTQTVTALAPNGEATVVFDTWAKPHAVGTYPTRCSTYLAGDATPTNDVKTGSFTIRAGGSGVVGWAARAPIPAGIKNKGVKDGGSLTAFEVEKGAALIYAFKGNGRYEFYEYNTETNVWTTRESIPAIGRVGKKKAVKKGATLSSTATAIYGSKGNNSVEFWQYTPGTDGAWAQKADVPVGAKNCKEGCDAVTVNVGGTDYIYFLKGTNTTEFYRYNTATDAWESRASAPVGTSGKNFKNGSNLAYDPDKNVIYAVKGSYNEFFCYAVDSDRWNAPLAPVPFIGTMGKKKKVKDGAGLVYTAGNAYLLKGGNTNEFWMYKVDSGASWSQLADMPAGAKYVKGGGALLYVPAMNALYAFRGNNQFDFYIYGLSSFANAPAPKTAAMSGRTTAISGLRIAPNPFSSATTIAYSLPSAGNVSLELYDVTGKLVSVLAEGYRPAGNFTSSVTRSALATGIYLVKLATETGTTTTKLIVE